MSDQKKKIIINLGISLFLIGLMVLGLNRDKILTKKAFFNSRTNSFCVNRYCFELKDKHWWYRSQVGLYQAKTENINQMVTKFNQINLETLVSTNGSKKHLYGFEGKPQVVLKINGRKLEIGNLNSSFTGTYVKNGDNVFATEILLSKETLANLNSYIDLTINKWPKDKIKKTNLKTQEEAIIEKVTNMVALDILKKVDISKVKHDRVVIDFDDYQKQLIIGETDGVYFASVDEVLFWEISQDDYFAIKSKIG